MFSATLAHPKTSCRTSSVFTMGSAMPDSVLKKIYHMLPENVNRNHCRRPVTVVTPCAATTMGIAEVGTLVKFMTCNPISDFPARSGDPHVHSNNAMCRSVTAAASINALSAGSMTQVISPVPMMVTPFVFNTF